MASNSMKDANEMPDVLLLAMCFSKYPTPSTS